MVHRREGTGTGKIFLQPNDDHMKNAHFHNRNNHDNSSILTSSNNFDSLPQLLNDSSINPTKSPAKSKPSSPNSTSSTPTRKRRPISLERSPKKGSSSPVKRSILRRENSLTQDPYNEITPPSQNGSKEEFPKPLRSGLLRVSRLQSTSLVKPPTIAKNRGRRKTICHSLEDISTLGRDNVFGKFHSTENIQVHDVFTLPIEKLTCSLPLAKLSFGVMQSILSSSTSHIGNFKSHLSDTDLTKDLATTTNDIVGLSSPQTAAKLLCLYCDKKFTSQKLLVKHTERVHATDGRRLSSRNSVASLSWPSIIAYPGCWYCGNSGHKLTATASTTSVADDLKSLFHHFLDAHSDKYYACKPCELRFSSAESMEEHVTKKHSKDPLSVKSDATKAPSKLSSKRTVAEEISSAEDLTIPLHVNVESLERTSPADETENVTCTAAVFSLKTRRQIKQQALQTKSTLVTRSCQNVLRNNEDTILTRLGVAQNRLPRGRKGTRNRRLVNTEVVKPEQSPNTVAKARNKIGKVVTTVMKDAVEVAQVKPTTSSRVEPLSCTFDDDFYETVSINVRQNLSCHLDGKLDGGPTSPSPISPIPTIPTIRSTVVRSPLNLDSEIHEATALSAVTAFPTLLTAEQYGSDWNTERKIKRPITKHSWKWKWDCVKKYKYVNEGGKIVKKIKQPMSGLRDLSKLDMWTQLTMRTKHELTRRESVETASTSDVLPLSSATRAEKQKQIAQLNSILDSRLFPQIVLEQTEQSVVKIEQECDILDLEAPDRIRSVVQRTAEEELIPQMLNLNRRSQFCHQRQDTIILSGEWARPRCYICFSCGGRFDMLKTLEEHKVSRHPYIYSTHYEIVGRELIEGDLYKHLYIPVRALRGHLEYKQKIKEMKSELEHGNGEEESMDSVNSLSASTTSANGNTTVTTLSTISSLEEHLLAAEAANIHVPRRCTKCKRMCNGKLELYRHMLNCFGDYAWRIAQKRKYRYFGVKSRRHARQNFQRMQRRKALAKKEDGTGTSTGGSGKSVKCSSVRTRPSDAETIRRMLENLPPKRACRQIIPNITKPRCIKFTKNMGLKKLVNVVGCSKKVKGKAVNVASTTLTAISSNMRRKQRLIARQITRRSGRMAMRLRELKQNSSKSKCEVVLKKSEVTNPQETAVKLMQVESNLMISDEKSSNGQKGLTNGGKKTKRVDSPPTEESSVVLPEKLAQSDKTPKKRTPVKQRSQEKSGKSPKAEDSPSKVVIKVTSPKTSPKRDNPIASHNSAESSSSSLKSTNPREPLNLEVPVASTRSPLLQVSPVNKRQRGKKLTDCIAKLQEKLGKPFFEGNENLDTVLSARQQSPPQDPPPSITPETLQENVSIAAALVEIASRTPKRKTVTRKIIQKTNEEAFVAPKPAPITPAIKVESEDDTAISTRSSSKDENLSITSDMYDSLVESDKCDVPVGPSTSRKDNTLNELNDSAVSSMSTDSITIQNSTPEKRHQRPSLNELFATHTELTGVRKSNRKIDRVGEFLPMCNQPEEGTVLNLSLADLNKTIGGAPLPPPVPAYFNERPTRKSRSGKSPPDSTTREPMPVLEEALNLTMVKRRTSLAAKTSPPTHRQESNILIPTRTQVTIEPPKNFVECNTDQTIVTCIESEKASIDVINTPPKQEKKQPKSKKVSPIPINANIPDVTLIASQMHPEELNTPIKSIETPKKGKGANKNAKKGKLTNTPADVMPEQHTPETMVMPQVDKDDAPKKEVQSALNTSVEVLPQLPPASSDTNQITTENFVNTTPIQSPTATKKAKGRPRKQSVPVDIIKPSVAENWTELSATNSSLETSAVNSSSKRGRKKNSAKQLHNIDQILAGIHLKRGEQSETGTSTEANTMSADAVVTSSMSHAIIDYPTIEATTENSAIEKEVMVYTAKPSLQTTATSDIAVKRKGRPRKSDKKATPKRPESDQEPRLDMPFLELGLTNLNTVGGANPGKSAEMPHLNIRDMPSKEETAIKSMQSDIVQSSVEPISNNKSLEESNELLQQDETCNRSGENLPSNIPQPSGSSIFDCLRAVQENVFFNRHDNKGLTRKYTRKSIPTIKKPIQAILQPIEMPSTSYSAANTDPVSEITLNDGKLLVTSLSDTISTDIIPAVESKDVQQSQMKSLETSKKAANKRRSNRNKSNVQTLPDNTNICKELADIVASFLDDGDDCTPQVPCGPITHDFIGPTRFPSVERPPLPIDQNAQNTPKLSDTSEVATKLKSDSENQESAEQTELSTAKLIEVSPDQKVVCKELSITLTKISVIEIEAQKSIVKKDEVTESKNNLPVEKPPRRTRGRKSSVKPENVSLTDSGIDSLRTEFDTTSTVESAETKLTKKQTRKRKNTISATSIEHLQDNALEPELISQTNSALNSTVETSNAIQNSEELNVIDTETKFPSTTEKIDESESLKSNEIQVETTPKQATARRRRKNELAAIVADQLLESFKEVDKSRIDELKKLENLAYEKSDDLYITGIRLTPLTKRKIVLSDTKEDSNPPKEIARQKTKRKTKSGNTSDLARGSDSEIATTDSERPLAKAKKKQGSKRKDKLNHENLFRNFADSEETPKLSIEPIALPKLGSRNFNLTFGTFRSVAGQEFSFGSQKSAAIKSNFIPGSAETSCSVDSQMIRLQEESSLKAPNETSNSKSSLQRKMKKKMSRLKSEKKAENENINELRTGLESFTFGKNTFPHFGKGIFGSVGFLGLFGSNNKDLNVQRSLSMSMPSLNIYDVDNASIDKKDEESRKPLLRPSLLSGVVGQGGTDSKSSRDPRLNKTTLKSTKNDSKKHASHISKSLQDLPALDSNEIFVKPRATSGLRSKKVGKTLQSPKIITLDDNDEDDDDNCLVAIAQSVNNRIMSEEEFSQNDEFEVSFPCETSAQSLPQPSSLDVSLLDEQKTSDLPNEDENTNTELIDMDLEDDISVYTSFSQDVSGKSRFGQKRRRRRSILLARRPKKVVPDPNQPEHSFDCTICNKSFGKATALAKHQQTFTHVQKLSEYEYLNKVNEPKEKKVAEDKVEASKVTSDNNDKPETNKKPKVSDGGSVRKEKKVHSMENVEMDDLPTGELPPEKLTSALPLLPPIVKPSEATPAKTTHVATEVEPISSPEPAETTYDRYQNTSRIALSQEERLFYECCNMLKGSETPMVERTYPAVPNAYGTYDVPNKPVTPKSSERFSYLGSEVTGNFQHGTAYTVKSPMSQSRTSPRYAYPKIDINQFSDISSDSNPAFPRSQHPHIGQIGEANATANKGPFYEQTTISPGRHGLGEQHGVVYHHSDTGAYYTGHEEGGRGIPLEMSDTTRVLSARTFTAEQRGKAVSVTGCAAGYSSIVMEAERSGVLSGNEQPLTSPLHSNSSQGSNTNITACRMRTKAAMKGYDNFKVSIPTLGLDMQQALERSPHGGCKLTALAEIALGSEAPITPPRYHQPHSTPSTPNTPIRDEVCEKQPPTLLHKSKPDINDKLAKKYQELIMNNIKPATAKMAKKKEVCDNTGNKTGLRSKQKGKKASGKGTTVSAVALSVASSLGNHGEIAEKPPKDIYEFEEESQEPIDKGVVGRGSPSKARNSIVIPERPFKNIGSEDQNTIKFHKPEEVVVTNEEESQMSTTSYSDRDDFNYGSMSEGDGEESEKEDEEQKSSDSDSCASAQTAKTHKCLIVGRIFGNANKNRPVESAEKPPVVVSEPKKKIPSQELNEMFDRLRKDGGKSGEDKRTNNANKGAGQDNKKDDGDRSSVGKNAKAGKMVDKKRKPIQGGKGSGAKAAATEPTKRENQRSSRSAEAYFPREIAKLQAELGMTAEEIAELIGEGKRKSQRKCAINRPRTVVDTWSSDEYEDFLSTKDVIAFIEEQEKRSKKKRVSGKIDKTNDEKNETSTVDLKELSKENQNESSHANKKIQSAGKQSGASAAVKEEKSNTVSVTAKDKKPQRVVDRLMQRFNKKRDTTKKVETKPTPIPATKLQNDVPTPAEVAKQLPAGQKTKTVVSSNAVNPIEEPATESNTSSKKQPTLSVKPRLKSRRHTDNDSESDFENELRRRKSSTTGKRTTSKISKRRKTIAFKEEHNDMTSDSKYMPKAKQTASLKSEPSPPVATLKTSSTTTTATTTSTSKSTEETSPSTGRPLARRKRVASEMLYYWSSSSSDEEFGRIETNEEDVTQKDEYLPKHGWIVGDSHKKLVTLLATAKGKKTTDLKEPTPRKK